ncbi:hypothetical protein BgiMline_035771 [Biomphalaria glabrata]|nr:hypothetical protein BgiMline_031069 [Biomphalaria glabrata]
MQSQVHSIHKTQETEEKKNENHNCNNVDNLLASVVTEPISAGDGDKADTENGNSPSKVTKTITALKPLEIEEKKRLLLENCVETLRSITKSSAREADVDNAPFTHKFRKSVLHVAKAYFGFKEGEVPYSVIQEHRETIARALVEHNIVHLLCDTLSEVLVRDDYSTSEGKMIVNNWFPMKNIILTLLNYSDCNDQVKKIITEHSQVLSLILKFLSDKLQRYLNSELTEDFEKMCKWFLSIVHNCGALKENLQRLRELNVIQTVLPYLDSQHESHRLTVLAILADLINEEEAELLCADVTLFQFILKSLDKALSTESHKNLGWSAQELTRAVKQLARNDANKEILVHEGCLPILVKLLDIGTEVELHEAIHCLWALSFNLKNKKRMMEEPELVDKVYKGYQTADNGSLRQAFQGVLWSLREELVKSSQFQAIGAEIGHLQNKVTSNAEQREQTFKGPSDIMKGHVMISYQWANQDTIKKICSELKANGVQVWIDIDNMGGSIIQAMAEAVEDANLVILAMSQLYKDSPNARAEAEYAFQLRKKIVPLIMQRNYKPDGWLGFVLGSKLYYDFSGKYPFDVSMKKLLKAVLEPAYNDDVDSQPLLKPTHNIALDTQPQKPPAASVDLVDQLKTWTSSDITKWLTKHNLHMTELQNLSQQEIIFLYNLKQEAAEFFYHCLETKLNLVTLQDLAKAAQAFEDMTI